MSSKSKLYRMQFICFVDPDHEDRAILQCWIRKQWQFFFFLANNGPARDNLKSHFPWDFVDVGDGVPSTDP